MNHVVCMDLSTFVETELPYSSYLFCAELQLNWDITPKIMSKSLWLRLFHFCWEMHQLNKLYKVFPDLFPIHYQSIYLQHFSTCWMRSILGFWIYSTLISLWTISHIICNRRIRIILTYWTQFIVYQGRYTWNLVYVDLGPVWQILSVWNGFVRNRSVRNRFVSSRPFCK